MATALWSSRWAEGCLWWSVGGSALGTGRSVLSRSTSDDPLWSRPATTGGRGSVTVDTTAGGGGEQRARSHCRFALLLIHFIPYALRHIRYLFI
jgi:hypothetical protein